MKSWIIDTSDCVESPLLPESKRRRRWDKRSWMDLYVVRYGDLRTRSNPQIAGLTEKFFAPENFFDFKPPAWYAEDYLDLTHLNLSGVFGMSLQ